MSEDQSIVRKTESAIDDLLDLWSRRKFVCLIVILVIVAPLSFGVYQQFVVMPKLKAEISQKQNKIGELESSFSRF